MNDPADRPPRPALSLQQLRCFESIHRLGSLTRAATELGLTQPALSKALGQLRVLAGDPLFVRGSAGMQATPRAARMAGSVRAALRLVDVELWADDDFDPRDARRTFTLCCSDLGQLLFLPGLRAVLRQQAPGIRLRVLPPHPLDLGAALAQGEVDLVIGAFPRMASGVCQQLLFRDTHACLLAVVHPRIGSTLSLAEFAAERHVVAAWQGTGHQAGAVERRILELCGPEGISARIAGFLAGPQLVADSDELLTLAATSARRLVHTAPVRVLPCPLDLPPLEVRQYWHESMRQDAAHRWLRETVFSRFGGRHAVADMQVAYPRDKAPRVVRAGSGS